MEDTINDEVDEEQEMPSDKVADLVEYIVCGLVDDEGAVSLDVTDSDEGSLIEVTCAEANPTPMPYTSSAAATSSGWEASTPCGPPLITCTSASGTKCGIRRPLTGNGTIWSPSPWITSVGTLIAARSARKSVSQSPIQIASASRLACLATSVAAETCSRGTINRGSPSPGTE